MKQLLTAIAAAGATLMTLAAVGASGHPAPDPATVTVSAHATSFHTAGSGLGAVTTFTDNLYIRGKRAGRDQVTCVATGPGTFLECYATDLLPGGQVESVGSFDPVHQTDFSVGITGGTGAYRNARGTIEIKVLTQTKSTYIYHLAH